MAKNNYKEKKRMAAKCSAVLYWPNS